MGGGGQPRQRKPVENSRLYELLDVSKEASEAEIKKAYRRQAMIHHPDKGGDADKFKDIQHAYEVLSNPDKRSLYDQGGEEALEHGGGGGGDDMDIFDLFGGGGRRRGPPPKQKGENVIFPLTLSLEEIYTGCTKKLRLTRNAICTGCKGKGGSSVSVCGGCKGQGVKVMVRQIGPGMITQQQVTCPQCKGEGNIIPPAAKCRECNGNKTIKEKKTIEVNVPKGCVPGSTHVFKGGADEAPNTIPGDVVVQFQQKEHPTFVRRGHHLFYNLDISLVEALGGFTAYITHLDNHVLQINHTGIIRPGDHKMIVDEGMPIASTHGIDTGNLYIKFNIVFPADNAITPDTLALLHKALGVPSTRPVPAHGAGAVVDLLPVNMEQEEKRFAKEEEYAQQQERRKRAQYDDDDDDEPRGGGGGGPACQQM